MRQSRSVSSWTEDDVALLFDVLFDLKVLLARIVSFVEGGDGDGEEEEADDEP